MPFGPSVASPQGVTMLGPPANVRIVQGTPTFHQRNLVIAAQTLDEFGAVVGACTVSLYDPTTNQVVAQTTSDATTGAYSFPWSDGVTAYYIRAYRAGSPVYIGTTTPTLVAI